MNIPVYKLTLNAPNTLIPEDNTGVEYVSLVDKPAIMINWHAFSSIESERVSGKYSFKTVDTDKRIISGPIMVANLPILRHDARGTYYAVFEADTIMQVVQRFFKQQNTAKVNLMHRDNATPEGIYMFESFIIDSTRGIKTPDGFEPLPDGSWFGSYKVDNDTLWNEYIKTGRFNGFSIEGSFAMEATGKTLPSTTDDDALVEMIVQELMKGNS